MSESCCRSSVRGYVASTHSHLVPFSNTQYENIHEDYQKKLRCRVKKKTLRHLHFKNNILLKQLKAYT